VLLYLCSNALKSQVSVMHNGGENALIENFQVCFSVLLITF